MLNPGMDPFVRRYRTFSENKARYLNFSSILIVVALGLYRLNALTRYGGPQRSQPRGSACRHGARPGWAQRTGLPGNERKWFVVNMCNNQPLKRPLTKVPL